MIHKIEKPVTPFQKYFMEADEKRAPNVKVIKQAPTSKRTKDFTDGSDDILDVSEDLDDETLPDDDSLDGTDFTDDTENQDDSEISEDDLDDMNFTDDDEESNDTAVSEDELELPDDDSLDGTDFTDDTEVHQEPSESEDAGEETPPVPNNNYNFNDAKKYSLYQDFMSIYNSLDNYISKLDSIVTDSPDANKIIKIATMQYRKLKDLTYDFMIIKYDTCSYVEAVLFYQRLITAIQLNFKVIKTTGIYKDARDKKKK